MLATHFLAETLSKRSRTIHIKAESQQFHNHIVLKKGYVHTNSNAMYTLIVMLHTHKIKTKLRLVQWLAPRGGGCYLLVKNYFLKKVPKQPAKYDMIYMYLVWQFCLHIMCSAPIPAKGVQLIILHCKLLLLK